MKKLIIDFFIITVLTTTIVSLAVLAGSAIAYLFTGELVLIEFLWTKLIKICAIIGIISSIVIFFVHHNTGHEE